MLSVKQMTSKMALLQAQQSTQSLQLAVQLSNFIALRGGQLDAAQLVSFYKAWPDAKGLLSGKVRHFCTAHPDILRFEVNSGSGFICLAHHARGFTTAGAPTPLPVAAVAAAAPAPTPLLAAALSSLESARLLSDFVTSKGGRTSKAQVYKFMALHPGVKPHLMGQVPAFCAKHPELLRFLESERFSVQVVEAGGGAESQEPANLEEQVVNAPPVVFALVTQEPAAKASAPAAPADSPRSDPWHSTVDPWASAAKKLCPLRAPIPTACAAPELIQNAAQPESFSASDGTPEGSKYTWTPSELRTLPKSEALNRSSCSIGDAVVQARLCLRHLESLAQTSSAAVERREEAVAAREAQVLQCEAEQRAREAENNRADVACRRSSLPDCGFAAALKHCCHHLGSKKSERLGNGIVVTDARTSRARI